MLDFIKIKSPYTSAYHDAVETGLRDLEKQAVLEALRNHRYGGSIADLELASSWLGRHRGWSLDPARLVMTHGTLNSIDLLLSYLVGRGGTLFVEELTFHHVPWLAERLGIRVVPIAMDHEGIRPEELDAGCRSAPGSKALFCVPIAQNPTCATMSNERRQSIARVSERHGLHIIEDDAQALVVDALPGPIAAISGLTWWVMGLSKCITTGLRIAYIGAPTKTLAQDFLTKSLLQSTWYPAPLSAELFNHWMKSGEADLILSEVREEARWRSAAAQTALRGTEAVSTPGALHVWVPRREGESEPLAGQLRKKGVSARPGSEFAACRNRQAGGTRLSLTNETKLRLENGLETVLSELAGRSR